MSKPISRREYEDALCGRVRAMRERCNYTQREMAELLGATMEQYRKFEVRSPMPAYYLVRFAAIAQVDMEYLLTGRHRQGPRHTTASATVPRRRSSTG